LRARRACDTWVPGPSTSPLAAVAIVLPGYVPVVAALEPVLYDLPPRLVGIDGRHGVGKTTLGRYLAWRFNVTLIESDLFANAGSVMRGYHLDEINRIVQLRLDKPRPVLAEGVALLRLLEQLQRRADFLIYCESDDSESDDVLGPVA
jgi:hypothetical protein